MILVLVDKMEFSDSAGTRFGGRTLMFRFIDMIDATSVILDVERFRYSNDRDRMDIFAL